jgi:hypothetical protein
MSRRSELEKLSSAELHDRAMRLAEHRLDVRFLWSLIETIPEAEVAAGHLDRAESDVVHVISLLRDLLRSGKGDLADALRPLYLDYLEKHE